MQNTRLSLGFLLSIISAYLLFSFYYQGNLSKDSMQYIAFAQSIDFQHIPQYFGVWPILYPLCLKIIDTLVPINAEISHWLIYSKLLNLGILTLIAQILYQQIGLRFSALLLCSPAILVIFRFTWSESLFIFFLLLFAFTLRTLIKDRLHLNDRQILGHFMRLALYAYLCFLTKYIALFLIVPIMAIFLLFKRSHLLGVLLSYCLAIALYLYMNLKITGHLSGTARGVNDLSMIFLFLSLIKASLKEYLIYLPMLWLFYRKIKSVSLSQYAGELSIIGLGILYLISLYSLRLISHFDLFSTRLVYPGVFLTLLGIALIIDLDQVKSRSTLIISACIALSLLWVYEFKPLSQKILNHEQAFMAIKDPCDRLAISKIKGIDRYLVLSNPRLDQFKDIAGYEAYFDHICYQQRLVILDAPYHLADRTIDVFERYRDQPGFYIDFLSYHDFNEYWMMLSNDLHRYDPSIKTLIQSHFKENRLIWVKNPLYLSNIPQIPLEISPEDQ